MKAVHETFIPSFRAAPSPAVAGTGAGRPRAQRPSVRLRTVLALLALWLAGVLPVAAQTKLVTVAGRVTEGGAPVAGVAVQMQGSFGTVDASGTTDANGNYSFSRTIFDGATYYIFTLVPVQGGAPFTPASLSPGGAPGVFSFSNQNFERLVPVTGTITSGGQPVAGVTVSIGGSNVVTDASGVYRLVRSAASNLTITPGKAGVVFTPASRTVNVATGMGAQNFDAAGTLSGRVTSSGTGAGAPGVTMMYGPRNSITTVDSVPVTQSPDYTTNFPSLVFFTTPASPSLWPGGPSDYVGAQFTTTLGVAAGTAYPPGDYTFSLSSDDGTKFYVDGVERYSADGVHAVAGGTFTVTLGAGSHLLEVRYFEAAGDASCILSTQQNGLWLPWQPPGGWQARYWNMAVTPTGSSTTTDADGNYTLTGVPLGRDYGVRPLASGYSFSPDYSTAVQALATGVNFQVTASPPTISNIPDQSLNEDVTAVVSFQIGDLHTAASSLTVTVTSDNATLFPAANLVLGGTGANRTLTLAPAFNQFGVAHLTVTVRDGNGTTASDTLQVTVASVNDAPVAAAGGALHFDGTGDNVTVAGFGGIAPADEITVEFWQKVATAKAQTSFATSPDNAANRVAASVPGADGVVTWDFGNANTTGRLTYTPPANSPIPGTWQHWAFVASKAAGVMNIYRNGALVATRTGMSSFLPGGQSLLLGQGLNGEIAEFRLWNYARNESEIRAAKDAPLAGTEAGLLIYYRFLEGYGPGVADSAVSVVNQGGANNGTLAGTPLWLPLNQTGLLREVWWGVNGSTLADLTGLATFPGSPDTTALLGAFEAPSNVGDYYGQRVSGYIVAPQTGSYTFWIASDDQSQLNLSTDENPANKSAIAYVSGYTAPRDWTAFPSQQSAPVPLVAGQRYFIEALMKEGSGGDHLAVRWKLPDNSIEEPIPAGRFQLNTLQSIAAGRYLVTVNEDTAKTIYLPGFDFETAVPTYSIITAPAHGTLSGSGSSRTYLPATNYNGGDSFAYRVTDGSGATSDATVFLRVMAANDPPVIATIPNQVTEEDTVAGPVHFVVTDPDNDVDTLQFSALSFDSSLVASENIIFGGAGTNRTLTITPVAGESGTVTIKVTAFDGTDSTSATFDLKIEPKPAYAVVDLGTLTGRASYLGAALNDQGLVVGEARSSQGQPVPFLHGGVEQGGSMGLLATLGGVTGQALAINNQGVVVGGSQNAALQTRAFRFDGVQTTDLGILVGGLGSTARAVNDDGIIAGSALNAGNLNRAWIYTNALTLLPALPSPFDYASQALGINGSNQVVGVAYSSGGQQRSFLYSGGTVSALGTLANDTNSTAAAINEFGLVVGGSTTTQQPGYALNFDGVNDQVTVPGGVWFNGDFTVEAWVYPRNFNYQERILDFGNGPSADNVVMGLSSGYTGRPFIDIFRGAGGGGIVATNALVANTWNHVAYVLSGTSAKIYLNGVLAGGGTVQVPATVVRTVNLIGGSNWSGDAHTDALLDEVRIWNTARTPEQVRAGMTGQFGTGEPGLLAAYHFDEGSGTVATAVGATPLTATLVNGPTWVAPLRTGERRAFSYDSLTAGSAMVSLGTLAGGGSSEATAVNDFGQVVGWAVTSTGQKHAFFHSAGKLNDLNDLLPEGAGWTLTEARDLNRRGEITGVGIAANGQTHAFLAVPANVIGKKITRPQGAVARLPEIELIQSNPGDTPDNSFFFSDANQKLYAIRPVTARLRWPVSNDLLDTNRITTLSINVWPRNPTIHVATSPVEIEPDAGGFAYSFQQQYHTTSADAQVDGGTKVFNATQPGYTVLGYLKNNGVTPNPEVHLPYFEVVRTVLWNDQRYLLDLQPADIGTPLTFAGHDDYPGRNGFMIFPNAFYDGVGADRAYDRDSRSGPILPVNLDTPAPDDDLVVAWYHRNGIGVAWPSYPVRYVAQWPASAPQIVIASGLGSGPLAPTLYPGKTIYNQPDKTLPGFNPNEEHALFAPSSTGDGLFALRDDLNAPLGYSQPYSLLKYREPASGEWRMKVFQVVRENATYRFRFTGDAGKEIQPPYPLSVLSLCPASYGVSGPYWEDYNGRLYARAAGLDTDLQDEIVVRYYYPLQPGFFYDLDKDGQPDVAVGSCLGWLDHRLDGNPQGQPIDVTFQIRWPDAPMLEIGETLLTAKHGLPDLKNFASAEIISDSADPGGTNVLDGSVRLFDPLSARVLKIADQGGIIGSPGTFQIPASIRRSNVGGQEVFDDLPYDLRLRLRYDPVNRWLIFSGYLDESGLGEPLLLLNVLSVRERDRIQALDGTGSATEWDKLVDALYDLTRNPNRVDANGDGQPDRALRVGLKNHYRIDLVSPVQVGGTNVTGVWSSRYADAGVDGALPTLLPATLQNGVLFYEQIGATTAVLDHVAGPKALTAGLATAPRQDFAPGTALNFDGTSRPVNAGGAVDLANRSFTVEFWAKRNRSSTSDFIAGQGTGVNNQGLHIGFRADNRFTFAFYGNDLNAFASYGTDTAAWHHWACTYDAATGQRVVYRDGVAIASDTASAAYQGSGDFVLGYAPVQSGSFSGQLDDVRIWNAALTGAQVRADRGKRLLGSEDGLLRYFRCDDSSTTTLKDDSGVGQDATLVNPLPRVASGAQTGILPRFITLAENSDPQLGLPVSLTVIKVDDGPFAGDLKVLYPDNAFDEKLPLRHSADFGAEPENFEFEWYYKPDTDGFDATQLPVTDPVSGAVTDTRGWLKYSANVPADGRGVNYITLGDGGSSSLLTLGDNWFVMRYRGYVIDGQTNWSDWIGDPASKSPIRAQLAEGWVKRVVRGINPFEARTQDFHASPTSTYTSMLISAGERYEGDVALNASADNLNSLGLIQLYTTVLNRGKNLSIDGIPAVDYDPANNALLLAASRVADLYTLLGNEAFADAADPTIGFTTDSINYKSLASSIFAFQNQVDSSLEEELALLRGRDDKTSGVQGAPVYNRLVWNFTSGDGEVAYAQTYNISDQNRDGFLDEKDARIMFPQGHGDAWGHYLTAMTTYYDLLRHPHYTWKPRTESVLVAGTAVPVDYLDERKFANIAAAKARTGAQLADLTYRLNYVDDPDGQWQGYKDTDPARAWGVSEWARRAGQGAFCDWVTANAILFATDPDPTHTGIQKIDRTTVSELDEIAAQAEEVQSQLELADRGVNPLGLAKGALTFDIDPAQVDAGKTHFEQVYDRALKAMNNATMVWDQANELSEQLRRSQDSTEQFTQRVDEQERDYKNRLIEIFGYPYGGDIGAGKTYPSAYDGPDLYHWMYVNTVEITGETATPSTTLTAFYSRLDEYVPKLAGSTIGNSFFFENDLGSIPTVAQLNATNLIVSYPFSATSFGFVAPDVWGQRRAPGTLQLALSDLVQQEAQLKAAVSRYDNQLQRIQDAMDLLDANYQLNQERLTIRTDSRAERKQLGVQVGALRIAAGWSAGIAASIWGTADSIIEGMPRVVGLSNDATAPARGALKAAANVASKGLKLSAGVMETTAGILEAKSRGIEVDADIAIENLTEKFELDQRLKELEQMIRDEEPLRIEMYNQCEVVQQTAGKFLADLATGERLIEERIAFRRRAAARTQETRYQDMAFRIFRNDALQKYRAQFDLAARYVYLAGEAYDFETGLLGSDSGSGRKFLTDIIRQRSLGQMENGVPVAGVRGLADPLARLEQNFSVLKPQLGFNNPQTETDRFSLRTENFRIHADAGSDGAWREQLTRARVADLWAVPEFRRYCRPFAPESSGAQPGIVLRFRTGVNFGENFFGWPLAGGDSAYDPTLFATKIRSVGVWFAGYDGNGLSRTPRVYLVPAGTDILRAPSDDSLATRAWRVLDQKIPVPFRLGFSDLNSPSYIPANDSLSGNFAEMRRFSSFRAYHDSGAFTPSEVSTDSRLIGRSVANTEWLLIIPGGTLLNDSTQGLDSFVNSVGDIKLFFQTYAYSGN